MPRYDEPSGSWLIMEYKKKLERWEKILKYGTCSNRYTSRDMLHEMVMKMTLRSIIGERQTYECVFL